MSKPDPLAEKLAAAVRPLVKGIRVYREYRFSKLRRWRFDLCVPKLKLAFEVEGRDHGRAKQHRSDCEKFNAAHAMGWRVYRYPASAVLTKKRLPLIAEQIARVIAGVVDHSSDVTTLTG